MTRPVFSIKRIVEPELLDELPPADPRAIQSRRDLRRVNFFMGNVGIIERLLRQNFPDQPPNRIVELGAGDGTFMLQVARRFAPRWKNIEVILIDQQNLVEPATIQQLKQLDWSPKIVCADAFDWLAQDERADCILANLFLHHFHSEKLAELLRLASLKTKAFLACEPRRSAFAIVGTKLLRLIGCNEVTRHDALVSVRAGFRENEISTFFCPQDQNWKIAEDRAGLFSHSFSATKHF